MRDVPMPRVRVPARIAVPQPDGRTAYPRIVQYVTSDGSTLDLPPDGDVTYRILVRDLSAYDQLRQTGALEVGHRLPSAVPAVDNRVAPGA